VCGAEIAIKEITDRISDIEFHLVTMRFSNVDAKEEKIGNIIVHRIGSHRSYLSKIFFVFRAAGFAKRLHVQQKFDAAWAMMSYMLVPVALLRLGGTKLPYVLTLQEGDTYKHMFGRLRVWPLLPFISYGFRHATVVQTISTHLSAWARKRGYHGPLEVIPNGVDVQKFTGDKLPHQRMVLITASRLVPKNGLDVVVRALKDLPNLQFKIFGTGPEENKLRSLAHKVGVENRVDFDQEPHIEVAREIARAMNQQFGTDFPEPRRFATAGEYVPSLAGEGKMSKSVEGSYINITDDLVTIQKRLAGAPTDSGKGRIEEDVLQSSTKTRKTYIDQSGKISPGVASLLQFVELFQGAERRTAYEAAYTSTGVRYGDLKKELAQAILTELQPLQERRRELEADPQRVDAIIADGAARARTVAEQTAREVRVAMGLA
jgi:hypothetical protein